MATRSKTIRKSAKPATARGPKPSSPIQFTAMLLRPKSTGNGTAISKGDASWLFLKVPAPASAKLPSRSRVSVEGDFNGTAFQATLEPDGDGGHWLKVDEKLQKSLKKAGAQVPEAGDAATLSITPLPADREPEPEVPADVRKAFAEASSKAREVWKDITPIARRDWIHWIVSAKQAVTRAKRIATACDMLGKGKRRPCCFDRSGKYDKSLSCPIADDE